MVVEELYVLALVLTQIWPFCLSQEIARVRGRDVVVMQYHSAIC